VPVLLLPVLLLSLLPPLLLCVVLLPVLLVELPPTAQSTKSVGHVLVLPGPRLPYRVHMYLAEYFLF
jgi:hypothetical protein